jgi:hypothetical protein
MKTLKISSFVIMLAIVSMGMGFPNLVSNDELSEQNKKKKDRTCGNTEMMSCTRHAKTVEVSAKKNEAAKNQVCLQRQKPVKQGKVASSASNKEYKPSNISVKVFDRSGNLITNQTVAIEQFLHVNFAAQNLPANSIFVRLCENTAYYFLSVARK